MGYKWYNILEYYLILISNNMKNMLIKTRKTLAIVSGILFSAVILNSVSSRVPVTYVEAKQSEAIGNLSISTNVQIEEKLTAQDYTVSYAPAYVPDSTKVANIRNYLAKRNAPLADYAEEFVKAADQYDIDYRIVASISVIESGGGKNCFRPYNGWGWGKMTFSSWEEGIWTVSKGIAKYYSRGLNTPKLISTYYCPPTADIWAGKVQFVMDKMGQ